MSCYLVDANRSRAKAFLSERDIPLPFTVLHDLEVRNALRLGIFRRLITESIVSDSLPHAWIAPLGPPMANPAFATIGAAHRRARLTFPKTGGPFSPGASRFPDDRTHAAWSAPPFPEDRCPSRPAASRFSDDRTRSRVSAPRSPDDRSSFRTNRVAILDYL